MRRKQHFIDSTEVLWSLDIHTHTHTTVLLQREDLDAKRRLTMVIFFFRNTGFSKLDIKSRVKQIKWTVLLRFYFVFSTSSHV